MGTKPARFDQVTTGRAAIFPGGRPVRLPDHRDGTDVLVQEAGVQ